MYSCTSCGSDNCYGDPQMGYICQDCGHDSFVDPDEDDITECPGCGQKDLWDADALFCAACGTTYVLPEDEPRELEFDANTYVKNGKYVPNDNEPILTDSELKKAIASIWKDHGAPQVYYYPEWKVEPYKPYAELVAKLEKWPFIKVYNTQHWFNKYISKKIQKQTGTDVLDFPKAIGPFIFMPDRLKDTKYGYCALKHEGTHAKDFWKFGVIPFFLMQFILPKGPSGRALLEYRGYRASMEADLEVYGYISDKDPAVYANHLAGKMYNYCFPWPKLMEKWFENARQKMLKKHHPYTMSIVKEN